MVKHIVFILRGISGAGKSTFAKEFAKYCFDNKVDYTVVSADDFFEDYEGNYNFDASLLSNAHAECLKGFIASLQSKDAEETHVVMVDNTNLTRDEALPYVAIAAAYGYEVNIMDFSVEIDVAYLRSKHMITYAGLNNQFYNWQNNKESVLFKKYFKEVSIFQNNQLSCAIRCIKE